MPDPNLLSQRLPFRNIYYKTIQKGSLISCQYLYWKHDPYPLVLITDIGAGSQVGLIQGEAGIRGVNLHYLTYRYISDMLNKYCDQRGFSYSLIKSDQYITNAYRTYKQSGLRQIKLLDCQVINAMLQTARSYRPDQIKKIREQIQEQLQRQVNPKAEDIAKQYESQITPREGFEQLSKELRPYGRQKPTLGTIPPIPPQKPIPPIG